MTVPRSARVNPKKTEPLGKLRLLLCLLTLAVYANTFGLGFALDAIGVVQGDPRVHAVTAQNLALIFQNDYWWPSSVDTLYRPFTTLSFLFNYAVLGNAENAAGYHVLNVLLHMANVLLVFQLALAVLRQRTPAFFAAGLWAVHPVLTETVANIAGRADLLAAMAVLGGLILYIRAMSSVPWRGMVAGLAALAVFGMFSKESAVVLLGLMLLWDLTYGAGWRGGGVRRAAAYGAVVCALALMLAARFAVFASAPVPEMPFVDNPLRGAGFLVARWTAVKMVGMDLLLLLWPLPLSSERGFAQIVPAAAGDAGAWLAFAAITGILVTVTLRYRRDKPMFWAAGMFGIALLPVSNLVVLIGATMAERFLYLPSVGFTIAAAALLYRNAIPLTEKPRNNPGTQAGAAGAVVRSCKSWRTGGTEVPRRLKSAPRGAGFILRRASARLCRYANFCNQVLGLALVVLLSCRTFARNGDWRDNLTLARADVRHAPRSARLREMLATSLFAQDPVRNLDAAIESGEAAWEILRVLPAAEIYQQTPARLGLTIVSRAMLPESRGTVNGTRSRQPCWSARGRLRGPSKELMTRRSWPTGNRWRPGWLISPYTRI